VTALSRFLNTIVVHRVKKKEFFCPVFLRLFNTCAGMNAQCDEHRKLPVQRIGVTIRQAKDIPSKAWDKSLGLYSELISHIRALNTTYFVHLTEQATLLRPTA
jgi:hypothetical protein